MKKKKAKSNKNPNGNPYLQDDNYPKCQRRLEKEAHCCTENRVDIVLWLCGVSDSQFYIFAPLYAFLVDCDIYRS